MAGRGRDAHGCLHRAPRGASLGLGYLGVGALKGAILGAVIAPAAGGLEQIVLHRLWRRLSLVHAMLVRATLYSLLTVGVYLAVSAAFSPWVPWDPQRSMMLPVVGITFVSSLVGSGVFALPGTVAASLGWLAVLGWVGAGFVACAIILSFAEVAS